MIYLDGASNTLYVAGRGPKPVSAVKPANFNPDAVAGLYAFTLGPGCVEPAFAFFKPVDTSLPQSGNEADCHGVWGVNDEIWIIDQAATGAVKTMGRPETDYARLDAMNQLGNGLFAASLHDEVLPVREAELSLRRRLGLPEEDVFVVQGNLAAAYQMVGRPESALQMYRDVYSGRLKLQGEEHDGTLLAANNYAHCLLCQRKCEEAKSLLRKTIPVARRVLGENHILTLKLRWKYAQSLYHDAAATLDDLREAVTTLEDAERIARRVFGGAHPLTLATEEGLRVARAVLRARDPPPSSP